MVMTCRHVQQLRDPYLDGELSAGLTAEVHAHLLQCPACQRQVEMVRVLGNVIADDRSEPAPPPELADRILAALPGAAAGSRARLLTRRSRRRRLWRRVVGVGMPAAAALLFFCVVAWPSTPRDLRPTLVKGKAVEAVGATTVVDSTLDILKGTRQAADSVNRVLEISANEARRGVRATLGQVQDRPVSFLDIFLEPFSGLFERPPSAKTDSNEREVVRF